MYNIYLTTPVLEEAELVKLEADPLLAFTFNDAVNNEIKDTGSSIISNFFLFNFFFQRKEKKKLKIPDFFSNSLL